MIRDKQIVSCFSIDSVIDQVVSKVASKSVPDARNSESFIKEKWDGQARMHKEWIDSRRIDNVDVGTKIDIRDTEYIWCEGTVKIKIECPNRDPLLVVHYEGWNKYFDEIIKQNSPRLAPHGCYSKRKDLPRYLLKAENSMVGVIVNRVLPKEVKVESKKAEESEGQVAIPTDPEKQKTP